MGDDIMGCKPDYLNLGMQAGEEVRVNYNNSFRFFLCVLPVKITAP